MAFLKNVRKIVYQLDLFCSSQLLRYNKDTEYKTLTGGLLSLMIVIVITAGFTSMIADTLNRSSISSTITTTKQSDPPLATLIPNKENMFMFAIEIQSLDLTYIGNLSQIPRYFDVQTYFAQVNNGVPSYMPITLEQCTYQHWSMMPDFAEHFDSFGISNWLCLPLNVPISLRGSYTSPIYDVVQINVFPCQNDTQNGTCASQEEISNLFDTYGNFYLTINYVNPVINPNEQDYISYYIEGNDYVIFSETIGSQAWFQFSDFTINTDNSIWPFTDLHTQTGCIVEQKAINHPYAVTPMSPLASAYLAKSENSLVYNREVQKISAVFSYIGGLVGAITAFLFLIKVYTDSSLQITIGLNLFQEKEPQKEEGNSHIGVNGFNFLGFVRLTFYRFLKLVGWGGSWDQSQRLERYQDEAVRQMDVQLLLKRLIKLESCMTRLFTHEQLKEMKEMEIITVESAQKMRQLLLKSNASRKSTKEQQADKEKDGNSPSPPSNSSGFQSGILMKRSNYFENKMTIDENIYELKMPPRACDYPPGIQYIDENDFQTKANLQLGKLRKIKQDRKTPNSILGLFPNNQVFPM